MAEAIKPLTIGPTTLVGFPRLGIDKIPAKVDTGADSSSIWASNIRESRGWLYFTLFGDTSPYFTGEELKTRDYQVRSIKNSFGQTEFRYKVKLAASIEGRSIKVRFTLANRSASAYPILIGRRTLHGRFLVDVTRHHKDIKQKVLVLDVKKINSVENFFVKLEAESKNLSFRHTTIDDLNFLIDEKGVKAFVGTEDISNFDFVYFKSVMDNRDPAVALAHYLSKRGIPFLDRAIMHFPLNNKLAQYVVLADESIRVPRSLYMSPSKMKDAYPYLVDYLGLPFVLKDVQGSKGRNNFLIKSQADFDTLYSNQATSGLSFIAQQFIPNDGDYRVLVFGKRVGLVIQRKGAGGSHLNNVSSGGAAAMSDERVLPGSIRRKCVQAADLIKLEVAGIDVVKDKSTGLWYFLEVQHGPQITSSSFVDEKRAEFLKFLNKKLR
ncbi:MAG TPA: RimK/LysX family protein [Candidatus Saccharimonadales bacterium]|nr:RimK/LysX family protein [Candidatus Saccharimonadales bacterium]